jgi:hypothetical protein
MSTVTLAPAKVKTVVVTVEPFALPEDAVGVILTTLTGKKGCCTLYRCTRIEGIDDLAFQLTKMFSPGSDPEAESYAINLSMSTCECKGHLRHGHCKHLTATRQLFERGVLP